MLLARRLPEELLVSNDPEVIKSKLEDLLEVYVNHEDTDFPMQSICADTSRIDRHGTIQLQISEVRFAGGQILARLGIAVPIVDIHLQKRRSAVIEGHLSLRVSESGEIEIT